MKLSWDSFQYFGCTKSEYYQCMDMITASNQKKVRYIAVCAAAMTIILSIIATFIPLISFFRPIYITMAIACTIIYGCTYIPKRAFIFVTMYIELFIFYAFATALALTLSDERATLIPIFLILMPILMTDKYMRMAVFNTICCALYCLVIARYKEATIVAYDIFSAICSLMIFLVGYHLPQNAIVTGFINHRNSQRLIALLECTQQELEYKSNIDELTNLNNRRSFVTCVEDQMQSHRGISALCIMDVDDFKVINDTHGHLVGDITLQRIAKVIRQTLPRQNLCGRLGGDEFIMYLQDIHSVAQALALVQDLIHTINDLNVGDGVDPIAVSIGITFVQEGEDFKQLYRKADKALYMAKQAGKNQIKVF